jgi:hypothetical protein
VKERRIGVALVPALLAAIVTAVPASAGPASAGPVAARPGQAGDRAEFVFASGLDHGPVEGSSPGMHQTDGPGTTLEWQSAVRRTGTGAYHAVGGDLQGDETIGNQVSSTPFGGLEVWVGGAFRFGSFPEADGVWLIATVPSDGVAGADDKPVVSIASTGRLRLTGSNSRDRFVQTSFRLERNRWYYLVLHGRNGPGQTQQLFVYRGRTGRLIERLDLVMDVTGSFVNRLTKWGFGTSQDSTGLEYWLDDLYHARGGSNPGPVRVVPRAATGATGGFAAVGAPTADAAIDDVDPDGNTTYIEGSGGDAATFRLTPLSPGRGERVLLVQATGIGRSSSSDAASAGVGVSIAGRSYEASVALPAAFAPVGAAWAVNPSTDRPWRRRDAFAGALVAAGDEVRFTAMWWDVVYRS